MKLLKELLENQEDLPSFVQKVEKDTAYSLDMPLYRGMKVGNEFGRKDIRKNRTPLTATELETVLFNDMFEEYNGIPNVRNSSLFTSTLKTEASAYGDAYVVFPNKGSKFIFNPKVSDSYVKFVFPPSGVPPSVANDIVNAIHPINPVVDSKEDLEEALEEFLSDGEELKAFSTDQVENTLKAIKEIAEMRMNIELMKGYTVSSEPPQPEEGRTLNMEVMVNGDYYYYATALLYASEISEKLKGE